MGGVPQQDVDRSGERLGLNNDRRDLFVLISSSSPDIILTSSGKLLPVLIALLMTSYCSISSACKRNFLLAYYNVILHKWFYTLISTTFPYRLILASVPYLYPVSI